MDIKKSYANGFTLIEVLVVIVIIAIVSGVALLTFSHDRQRDCVRVADSISHLLSLAETDAIFHSTTFGLVISSNGFEMLQYREGDASWKALPNRYYHFHRLGSDIQLTLYIDNKKVSLGGAPSIIISSDGSVTPFVLGIGLSDELPSYQLKMDSHHEISAGSFHEEE